MKFSTRKMVWSLFFFIWFIPTSVYCAEYISVAKDGVNMRAGPSLESEIFWITFKDYPLKVIQKKGRWIKVKDFENDIGWVYGPLTNKRKNVIVKVTGANIRVGPGINYEIVDKARYGVVFQLIGVDGWADEIWFNVLYRDGTRGWMYEKLLWPNDLEWAQKIEVKAR